MSGAIPPIPIRLHGVVLSWKKSTGTSLPLPATKSYTRSTSRIIVNCSHLLRRTEAFYMKTDDKYSEHSEWEAKKYGMNIAARIFCSYTSNSPISWTHGVSLSEYCNIVRIGHGHLLSNSSQNTIRYFVIIHFLHNQGNDIVSKDKTRGKIVYFERSRDTFYSVTVLIFYIQQCACKRALTMRYKQSGKEV
jgi:hypothetical protein